jgi:hypothetical protein
MAFQPRQAWSLVNAKYNIRYHEFIELAIIEVLLFTLMVKIFNTLESKWLVEHTNTI